VDAGGLQVGWAGNLVQIPEKGRFRELDKARSADFSETEDGEIVTRPEGREPWCSEKTKKVTIFMLLMELNVVYIIKMRNIQL
jgi:hypothetical protein